MLRQRAERREERAIGFLRLLAVEHRMDDDRARFQLGAKRVGLGYVADDQFDLVRAQHVEPRVVG